MDNRKNGIVDEIELESSNKNSQDIDKNKFSSNTKININNISCNNQTSSVLYKSESKLNNNIIPKQNKKLLSINNCDSIHNISQNSLNIYSKDYLKNNKSEDLQFKNSTPRSNIDNEFKIKPYEILSSQKDLSSFKKSLSKSSNMVQENNNDLVNDIEIKNFNVEKMELYQKSIQLEMEREIELIRLKYTPNLNQLNYAIEYLKKNPHLKNLNEVEEYEKFSKSIEKTNNFSTKNYELSVGINSIVPPHNPIKVNSYKPNNISHLNKKLIRKTKN